MENHLQQISESLKTKLINTMDNMLSFVKKYPKAELPEVSNDFLIAKDILKKGEFNLVVCGRVKYGKSTFINSLIGRNLLPVCTDVATSRVFKISHAEEDSFYVVFSNGDREKISEEDLGKYGNQSVINSRGEVKAEASVAYIQVNTRMDFLPKGVSIIDTPGIGSTYPLHTQITKQFVKMADAALFILNPTPLDDMEIKFLKELAEITPNLMFVATKIDNKSKSATTDSIVGNTKKIEDSIGDKLYRKPCIWTMSSQSLLEAATSDDETSSDFKYLISGYDVVKEEILKLIFLTQGYYKTSVVYNTAVSYYQTIYKSLTNRKEQAKKAIQEYEHLLSQYDTAKNGFTAQMGDVKRKEVSEEIEKILKTLESNFNKKFSGDGTIAKKYEDEILLLGSDEDIAEYCESVGERLSSDIQNEWELLINLVQSKVQEAVVKFHDDCKMMIPEDLDLSVCCDGISDPVVENITIREKMSGVRSEMLMGTAMTGALGTLLGSASYFFPAVMTPILPVAYPVLILLGVGVIFWGAVSGREKAKAAHLTKSKNELKRYITDAIRNYRTQLTETSLENNKYKSLYQGFVEATRKQAKDSIETIYDKYQKEIQAMKSTIMKAKQDPEVVVALDFMLSKWEENKNDLKSIHTLLESINLE